jgi:sugar phosphate permease
MNKRHGIFYGWWIVAAIFLISAFSSGIIFFSLTAVLQPIVSEFGWSYAQVSLAASIRGFETSFLAVVVGYLIDRFGPRRLIFGGGIIIGAGLIMLSRVHSLMALYGCFVLMAFGLSACSGVILTTVVGNWFRKRVSIATGIVVCGAAFGGLLVPVVTWLIDTYTWRQAMVVLGIAAAAVILSLSVLVRHKPEQYGYLPDGERIVKPVSPGAPKTVLIEEDSARVRKALKSRAFWLIALSFMCHVLVTVSVVTHIMPYLSSIGISRSTASLVTSAIPLISIPGRLLFGWWGDRIDRRHLSAAGFVITGIGLLLLCFIDRLGIWLLVPFIILFGFGFGGPVPIQPGMLLERYGRARLGTIIGLCTGIMMVGIMLGPPVAGWIYDTTGRYQNAWYIFLGILALGTVLILLTPAHKKIINKIQLTRNKNQG